MALEVQFGNGSTSTTLNLLNPNIDSSLALSQSVSEQPTAGAGSSIPSADVNVARVVSPGIGSGTGGGVSVGYDTSHNAYSFDVSGSWNSVKNVLATSADAENIVLRDFVNVNVQLGGTGNSYVDIANAKRGIVTTGQGNDTIKISLLSNDSGWVNAFDVNSGAGNDTIVFSAGNATGQGGTVAGAATRVDGSYTTATIDAGSGNDLIDLRGTNLRLATITGAEGDDTFYSGNGKEVFTYGDVAGGSGSDTIFGFNAAVDRIDIANTQLASVEQIVVRGSLHVFFGEGDNVTEIVLRGQSTALSSDVFI